MPAAPISPNVFLGEPNVFRGEQTLELGQGFARVLPAAACNSRSHSHEHRRCAFALRAAQRRRDQVNVFRARGSFASRSWVSDARCTIRSFLLADPHSAEGLPAFEPGGPGHGFVAGRRAVVLDLRGWVHRFVVGCSAWGSPGWAHRCPAGPEGLRPCRWGPMPGRDTSTDPARPPRDQISRTDAMVFCRWACRSGVCGVAAGCRGWVGRSGVGGVAAGHWQCAGCSGVCGLGVGRWGWVVRSVGCRVGAGRRRSVGRSGVREFGAGPCRRGTLCSVRRDSRRGERCLRPATGGALRPGAAGASRPPAGNRASAAGARHAVVVGRRRDAAHARDETRHARRNSYATPSGRALWPIPPR